MLMILFVSSLVFSLPLAVTAFVLGDFAVLALLCAYTVSACLGASATLWRRI